MFHLPPFSCAKTAKGCATKSIPYAFDSFPAPQAYRAQTTHARMHILANHTHAQPQPQPQPSHSHRCAPAGTGGGAGYRCYCGCGCCCYCGYCYGYCCGCGCGCPACGAHQEGACGPRQVRSLVAPCGACPGRGGGGTSDGLPLGEGHRGGLRREQQRSRARRVTST